MDVITADRFRGGTETRSNQKLLLMKREARPRCPKQLQVAMKTIAGERSLQEWCAGEVCIC